MNVFRQTRIKKNRGVRKLKKNLLENEAPRRKRTGYHRVIPFTPCESHRLAV